MELTTAQQFELERMRRTIDAADDITALRSLCQQLLSAWHSQRAANLWLIRQQTGQAPRAC
jgi:hypothetical protein